ncbi:MAG TPA: rhodanese-like domain-containing protein [Azospirillum sp.]|nr:rhodanese-like domain-containing protein [Azospirillum sp.]
MRHESPVTAIGARVAGAALAVALALAAWPARADVPVPDGYRQDRYRSPTPSVLPGAATVDAGRVAELAAQGAVLLDVMPVTVSRLGGGAMWLVDEPHRTIAGAVWLPNVGTGAPSPEVETWYRGWLERLSGGDPGRPLVVFCKADCWMSWNAAKRALSYGYTAVHWFRDGTDGWAESGRTLVEGRLAGPPPETRTTEKGPTGKTDVSARAEREK